MEGAHGLPDRPPRFFYEGPSPPICVTTSGEEPLAIRHSSSTRYFPPHAGEVPSLAAPYPRDAFCRWPAASPQAFHLPHPLQLCAGVVPDLSFPSRWVSCRAFGEGQKGPRLAGPGEFPGACPPLAREGGEPWRKLLHLNAFRVNYRASPESFRMNRRR